MRSQLVFVLAMVACNEPVMIIEATNAAEIGEMSVHSGLCAKVSCLEVCELSGASSDLKKLGPGEIEIAIFNDNITTPFHVQTDVKCEGETAYTYRTVNFDLSAPGLDLPVELTLELGCSTPRHKWSSGPPGVRSDPEPATGCK